MDIHSNKSFTVYFLQNEEEVSVNNFYCSDLDLQLNSVIGAEIIENTPTILCFDSDDQDARLYMDGLNALPEGQLTEDDNGEIFLKANHKVTLYAIDFYPLIPAYYRMMISHNNCNYYCLVRIAPKLLTEEQWELMKNELEEELRGLSLDVIRKNLRPGDPLSRSIPSHILYKFMIIERHFPWVMAALNDLSKRSRHRICKDYVKVANEKAKVIDEYTIRRKVMHSEEFDVLHVPVKKIDYNLHENRWVVWVIKVICRELDSFQIAVYNSKININGEIRQFQYFNALNSEMEILLRKNALKDLDNFLLKAEEIKRALKIVQQCDWYKEVEYTNEPPNLTPALFKDSRYRAIYQLYRDLRGDEFSIQIDSTYAYQWKRTDKLYEIWGFIKLCRILTGDNLGFKATKGWIFGFDGDESGKVLIPVLPQDTIIMLSKENITIHAVYDSRLPGSDRDTTLDKQPIYTRGEHNRPDGRLDIYIDEVYSGSVVFDFKYRPLRNFWNMTQRSIKQRTREMNQVISYSSQCRSKYLYGEITSQNDQRAKTEAALETWVLYPKDDNQPLVSRSNSERITLIQFCPGTDNNHICEEIIRVINIAKKSFAETYDNK